MSENPSTGLFSGVFAGGAEMSDFEYQMAAPDGYHITPIAGDNWADPELFDSIIVTGTEAFTDSQLTKLAKHEPFVFVHHLQTPREGVSNLIDNSRMFVTHTPAHMYRELMWTKPKRTGQVLSHFDTSMIHPQKKEEFAVFAARPHPAKGLLNAQFWAIDNRKNLKIHTDSPREVVLDDLMHAKDFVHLPLLFESECRTVMEAVLAGCKVHTNELVGITSVDEWDNPEVLRNMIDKAGETFWNLVNR